MERGDVHNPPPKLPLAPSSPGPGLALEGTIVPPATCHYYTSNYCDSHVDHAWFHVTHSCPSFLIRCQWALVRGLLTQPKLEGSFLPDGTTVVQPSIETSVSVALETNQRLPSPLPPHRWTVFSPTGLVKHVRPPPLNLREPATVFG